jgi:signal transduction histidine kinase
VELPVVDQGERLGSIQVEMPGGRAPRPRELGLLSQLAHQTGMAIRDVRLADELAAQVEQLAERTRELAESRRRLINAGDAERSRVERAIATQVVVHLSAMPGRLRELSGPDDGTRTPLDPVLLSPLLASVDQALAALQEITRGVYPAQLVRAGLPIALGSLLARSGGRSRLTIDDSAADRRYGRQVEAAAYFCVAEAARELEEPFEVRLTVHDDELHLVARGGDRGGLPLAHMRDRVEAAGGSVTWTSKQAEGVVGVRLPASA